MSGERGAAERTPTDRGGRGGAAGSAAAAPSSSPSGMFAMAAAARRRLERLILYHPEDRDVLTEQMCLVRRQLEVFVECNGDGDSDDGDSGDDGGGSSSGALLAEGRAGIRCVHCSSLERRERARNASASPKEIRLIYQSVRNWQRHHLMACPLIPADVKAQFGSSQSTAKKKRSRSNKGVDVQSYWATMCARMGLVDTEKGLRLRKAALDGTWTDEMGMEAAAEYEKMNATTAKKSHSPKPSLLASSATPLLSAAARGSKEEGAIREAERDEDAAVDGSNRHQNLKEGDNEIFDDRFTDLDKEHSKGEDGTKAGRTLSQQTGKCPSGNEGIEGSCRRRRWPTLYCPEDREHLTEVACLMRQQIEVYALPPQKKKGSGGGAADTSSTSESGDLLLRVGLRCIHCAPPDDDEKNDDGERGGGASKSPQIRGAAFRPTSTRLVYQAVRNWQSSHFAACEAVPKSVRDDYEVLRDKGNRRVGGIRSYWERSCTRLGLVDTDDGLCLREDAVKGAMAMAALSSPSPSLRPIPAFTGAADSSPDVEAIEARDQLAAETVEASSETMAPPVPSPAAPGQLDRNNDSSENELPLNIDPMPLLSGTSDTSLAVGDFGSSDQQRPPAEQAPRQLDRNNDSSENELPLNIDPIMLSWTSDTSFLVGNFDSSHQQRPLAGELLARQDGQATSPPHRAPSSNDDLLKRMQMAIGAVRATVEIRTFSPTLSGATDRWDSRCDESSDNFAMVGEELYTLFAGKPPYDSQEHMSHDVEQRDQKRGRLPGGERRSFVPLRELGIPIALCNLVSRLLNGGDIGEDADCYKAVEEVEEDLRLMAEQPEKFLFRGPTGNFWIPENSLYGRDEEVSELLEAYERATNDAANASQKNAVVLVTGYAGTGKSSLVQAAHGPLLKRGARFVSGSFDAMRRMHSFSVLAAALDEYCSIVAQDVDSIGQVRVFITAAVGSEGGVLTSLIPNARLVMDVANDTSPTHVTGAEAMQRLIFLFRMLLRATCSRCKPVILFLDDLQWADEVSLELMTALVSDSEISGLLFIGTYRDNEVGSDHPLTNQLNCIQRSRRADFTSIHVGNLDKEAVNALVSDTLQILPRMALPLSEAVTQKTNGNALFVMQFLASLHDEGLLRFSLATRQWEWDTDAIRAKDIAESAVPLMITKILRFAPHVRQALRLAAGFGAQCQDDVLRIVDRAPDAPPDAVVNTPAALETAVTEGLLVKCESGYRFSHDLIHCAAYSLIPEEERKFFHLQVGRWLLQNASADELEAHLFVVVDQLNRGAEVIRDDDEERFRLAQLNLTAGKKASSISAFVPSSAYFKAGADLLADNDWERNREICLDLHNSAAEMDYILGRYEDLKNHVGSVLERASTLQEKLRAYFVLVQSTSAQENLNDAISTCFTILDQLGEPVPSTMSTDILQQEMAKTQALLASKMQQDEFLHLGTMQNADKKEAMKFLNLCIQILYTMPVYSPYMPLLACRIVQLSLLHGLSREAAFGFAAYGNMFGIITGDHAAAARLGRLALSMIDRFGARESLSWVVSIVYGVMIPWSAEPLPSVLPFHKHAIDVALSVGDNEGALYNAYYYIEIAVQSGYPLDKVRHEMSVYSRQMLEDENKKMRRLYTLGAPTRQFVACLLGQSADRAKLAGGEMDDDFVERYNGEKVHGSLGSIVYFFRSWLAFLFHNYEVAAVTVQDYRKSISSMDSNQAATLSRLTALTTFIHALSASSLARIDGGKKWVDSFEESAMQMREWSKSMPGGCQHNFELVRAEKAFLDGNHTDATRFYETAIDLAAKRRYLQDQALALERAGMFYLHIGDSYTASGLFERSHKCYMQWGAVSKAAHIRECYLI